jgi:hypothetical protein
MYWEDESNKDEENENENFLDDTQSTIIFYDKQNPSQSSSQNLTQNPKQSSIQNKGKKSQNQETPAGSQSVWKKWTLKRTTIYRFYKKGLCRSKKNCNFEHPKMCEVFK